MPGYIAFLRAINVGRHNTVKMDFLRHLFQSLGFSNVETFIAGGNVMFETTSKNAQALEREIEESLRQALGYAVTTFIKTGTELAAIDNYKPLICPDLLFVPERYQRIYFRSTSSGHIAGHQRYQHQDERDNSKSYGVRRAHAV